MAAPASLSALRKASVTVFTSATSSLAQASLTEKETALAAAQAALQAQQVQLDTATALGTPIAISP